MLSARLLVVAALASLCRGAYVLNEDYGSDMSFFDNFEFFTVSYERTDPCVELYTNISGG